MNEDWTKREVFELVAMFGAILEADPKESDSSIAGRAIGIADKTLKESEAKRDE